MVLKVVESIGFFVTNFLQTATELSVFPYSDHRVLICTMRNDNQGAEQGKSFSKLNASVSKVARVS